MEELTEIETVAQVIQLAVAPVFLLAGIAGLLNVLSVRLGRAVDRVRVVETRLGKERHPNTSMCYRQKSARCGVEYAWRTGLFVCLSPGHWWFVWLLFLCFSASSPR